MSWKDWFRKGSTKPKEGASPKMSISSTSEEAGKQKTQGAEEKPPKYPQPKILLLDLESEVASALEEKGYNVTSTSLGTPYLVSQSSGLFPVDRSFSLPHDYKEFEVVVIDLHYELEDKREIFDEVEVGVDDWWTDHKSGYVNPRLLNASFLQKDFDRILNTGGVFVVFANRFEIQDFRWGHRYGRRDFSNEERNQISNWSFLSLTRYTNYLSVGDDHGARVHDKVHFPQKREKDNRPFGTNKGVFQSSVTPLFRRLVHFVVHPFTATPTAPL